MPTRPARRLIAGLAAACAFTLGLAAPAHAALPAPDLRLADRVVAPGTTAEVNVRLLADDPASEEAVKYTHATFTFDLSGGPAGVGLVEDDASCTSVSATKVTCSEATFVASPTGYADFAVDLKAAQSAQVGATGALQATFSADDISPVTGTAKVEVPETVALKAGPDNELSLKPGSTFDSTVQVTNNSGSAVHGVVLTADEPNWALESTKQYSNCKYTDDGIYQNGLLSCRFDVDIAPGATVGAQLPLLLRKDTPAPGGQEARFHWWTVDSYEQAAVDLGLGGGEAGTEPALQLKPIITAHAAKAQVGEARQALRVKVLGSNKADLAVLGATVSGAAGTVVTAKLGMRNNGPASRWSDIGPVAEATVTLPPGTVFAEEEVPTGCTAVDFLPLDQVRTWRCRVQLYFEAGQTVTYEFPLRIETVIPNATGTIVLDKAYADTINTCNNKAQLIVNPTGTAGASPACTPSATPTGGTGGGDGDEPGLPITGPGAGPIAAAGALIVLLGVLLLVLTRRRRTDVDS